MSITVEMPAAEAHMRREDGRLIVRVTIPESYEDGMLILADNVRARKIHQLYVKMGLPRRPRTTGWDSQNHHLNGHCQQIAAHAGDSFDDVKMYVKCEAISAGYPMRTTSWGKAVPQSETDASTAEAAILIDTAHRIASQMGVALRESS